jgi:flagella basal body P-ring formation protein FlgA
VEFEAPTRLRLVQAPPGRRSQELVARVRGNRTGTDTAVVDVDVMVDGASAKRVPVQFKLTRYQQVLKTNGAIRAGTPLGADNLTVVREPVAQVTGLWLNTIEQVQGLNAARNLQANARVTLGDAVPPAVIHRGDIVTVVLTQGRVKVTAKAIANHDAALGARATLTNLNSRSALTGTVAAPGLVIVQNR